MKLIPALEVYEEDLAAQQVWSWFEAQLAPVEGLAFYRYPAIRLDGVRTPDLLILARGYEPLAVRCLPWSIEDIQEVGEDYWIVSGVRCPSPVAEVDDYAEELRHLFRKERQLRKIFSGHVAVALPNIAKVDFIRKFGEPEAPAWIWADRNMDGALVALSGPGLTEEQWALAQAVLQNTLSLRRTEDPVVVYDDPSKLGTAIAKLEQDIAVLDERQNEAAIQIPPGPQRIRGLAGTGKTVLLAMKAANIHIRFPERKILVTFFTQSLYPQLTSLITRFFRSFGGEDEPDWNILHVRHAWGGRAKAGVYAELASRQGVPALDFRTARSIDRSVPFRACCQTALRSRIDAVYDHILVDEAQDLPFEFFRILYQLSVQPHAICWAYDELQNLSSLFMPSLGELFGLDAGGKPLISLDGDYAAGIEKDLVLERSYRCPLQVLMLAHALGLGLYRRKGCVQMLKDTVSWRALGYEVEEGGEPNQPTVIFRPSENSPNRVGKIYTGTQALVTPRSFPTRAEELSFVAKAIKKDIHEEGVRPEQIVVVTLDPLSSKGDLASLQRELFANGIDSIMPGLLEDSAKFAERGRVTLCTVYRAKGNEAPVIYVVAAEMMASYVDEIDARNKAFTAISRSKGWVHITGSGPPMAAVEEEIRAILADIPRFRFRWPAEGEVYRQLDAETNRRRQQKRKAKKAVSELGRLDPDALLDLNPNEIDEAQRKVIIELAQRLQGG